MSIGDDHNHFCIYCGARIEPGQNFCSECGNPVYRKKHEARKVPVEYENKIIELENEYDIKQGRATELVEKIFDPNHMSYERFTSSITKSNNLFSTQVGIAKKMAEMDMDKNPFVEKELNAKLVTLQSFIDKMDDLINELIIHMSSNKEDINDINNLFNEMDDLIDSVKDY